MLLFLADQAAIAGKADSRSITG